MTLSIAQQNDELDLLRIIAQRFLAEIGLAGVNTNSTPTYDTDSRVEFRIGLEEPVVLVLSNHGDGRAESPHCWRWDVYSIVYHAGTFTPGEGGEPPSEEYRSEPGDHKISAGPSARVAAVRQAVVIYFATRARIVAQGLHGELTTEDEGAHHG